MNELDLKLLRSLMQVEGQPRPTLLLEGENYSLFDCGTIRRLLLRGSWEPSCALVAADFAVQEIWAHRLDGWTDDSIEFLDQVPNIQSVNIATRNRIDWTPLQRLAKLESVQVSCTADEQNEIDFTRLPSLRKCSLSPWRNEFDSVRRCRSLKSLFVRESGDQRELDLQELEGLEELLLFQCGSLRA